MKIRMRATIASFSYIKQSSYFKQLLFTLPPRKEAWTHSCTELTYQVCIQWCQFSRSFVPGFIYFIYHCVLCSFLLTKPATVTACVLLWFYPSYLDKHEHLFGGLTVRKMSRYGLFAGLYFPVFCPNIGKYEPEKTLYLDSLHAVTKLSSP